VVEVQHIKTNKTQVVHVDRLMPFTTAPQITSPRTPTLNTFVSPAPAPVDSSALRSCEHQSPTIARRHTIPPVLRRSTRPDRDNFPSVKNKRANRFTRFNGLTDLTDSTDLADSTDSTDLTD